MAMPMPSPPTPPPPPVPRPPPKSVANGRFTLSKQLGSGCFGEVWLGNDKTKNKIVAVKLELKGDTKQLANEYEILSTLKRPSQQQGFTEIFHFGREGESHVCLVMELLGKSLEEWLAHCGGKFRVTTVALIGEQIVRRLEYLHSKCIIHRDIKPENFLMGVGPKAHIVYIIDFGLSEFYYDEGQHASQMKDSLTGTARYSSINAHDKAQSRRDDLEANGHMLVFFILGTLPWCGLPPAPGKEEFGQIRDMKKAIKLADLCKGTPPEFEDYISYCRTMSYRQRPDYSRLRLLFTRVLQSQGSVKAHDLQWLQDDKEFSADILVPLGVWPDIDQPDDAEPEASVCGCCKRRETLTKSSTISQPLSMARDPVDEAGIGNRQLSTDTE